MRSPLTSSPCVFLHHSSWVLKVKSLYLSFYMYIIVTSPRKPQDVSENQTDQEKMLSVFLSNLSVTVSEYTDEIWYTSDT